MKEKALVALSGGVDSTVAAYLAQAQGLDCIGGTLRLYAGSDACGSMQDAEDARAAAERLGMEFRLLDATAPFDACVIQKFVQSYETGLTPSPCVDCNRFLKFGVLLEQALQIGCSCLVTGHYAQIRPDPDSGRYLLYRAADVGKDQSYFLCMLTQHQLAHTRFPLGGMTKAQVRQIAEEQGFENARKRDSQDICFVPDGDYTRFLRAYTGKDYPKGSFLDLQGNVIGQHQGAVCYTCGQRKGLGLIMGEPVYVCHKDMAANTVTVGPDSALFHRTLLADDWNWIPFPELTQPIRVTAKLRSRMAEQPATVYPESNGAARVVFDQPQRAITPGQSVVLYQGDMVVGGGCIRRVVPEE